jgi:ATP-binding cassette subfamily F protein 3
MRVIHDRDSQVSKELYMDNLTLVVGGRNLVEDAKLHLPQGRKYGLVGRNGIGK